MALYILQGTHHVPKDDGVDRCFIETDEEGIWSLIKTNKHWKSLSVYEFPKNPFYSHNEYERARFLDQIDLEKKEAAERELYLKLKEKYEKHI